MAIKIIKGNIWNTKCQVVVNTVNCVGVMGAGIALEAKLRYPDMFEKYKEICKAKQLNIGQLWLYTKSQPYWILNFPTKTDWNLPSKESYIIDGLKKFRETYKEKSIKSIAFPILGGLNGGLDENLVINIMQEFLSDLNDIEIEIYQYDPKAVDDFFIAFKEKILGSDLETLAKEAKIQRRYLDIIYQTLENNDNIFQVNQLLKIKGIGIGTLEKIFAFMKNDTAVQQSLF